MKNHNLINHANYAKQKRELVAHIVTITQPQKFCDVIANQKHDFDCEFSFFEEKNHTCIKYRIKATLKLICQESLEVFDYPFDVSNTIILVEDDRLAGDSQYEPFICLESNIDLTDIIREEILLELPLVPKKDTKNCKKAKKHSYYSEHENVIEEKKNPFEILKKLK